MAQVQTKQMDSERYHSNNDSYNLENNFVRITLQVYYIELLVIVVKLYYFTNVLREAIVNTNHLVTQYIFELLSDFGVI